MKPPKVITKGITEEGFAFAVLFLNNSHHCGYVEVPEGHPLYQIEYSSTVKGLNLTEDTEIGKRSLFVTLVSSDLENVRPDLYFDVHGGLTFSGYLDVVDPELEGFWYGFDCNHYGDLPYGGADYPREGTFKDAAYVEAECRSLSKQLAAVTLQENADEPS